MGKIRTLIIVSGCVFLSNLSFGMFCPETGRFLQREPLGVNPAGGKENQFKINDQYKDGMNLYAYVTNNPIIKFDAYGLFGMIPPGPGNPFPQPLILPKKKIDCNPTCGPDISISVIALLSKITFKFHDWDEKEQKRHCDELYNIADGGAGDAWMSTIKRHGLDNKPSSYGCPSSSCAGTVEMFGKCYNAHAVNYAVFGHMNSLCGISKWKMRLAIDGHKRITHGPLFRNDLEETFGWADWGYDGPIGADPKSTHTHCKTTCKDSTFHDYVWNWKP